jgi:hypothetical protein
LALPARRMALKKGLVDVAVLQAVNGKPYSKNYGN